MKLKVHGLLLILISLIFIFHANAQMKKGNIYLGGQFGLSISTQAGKSPLYSIMPNGGLMITDKLSWDIGIGYSVQMHNTDNTYYSVININNINTFSVQTGLSQYFKLNEQFAIVLSEAAGYSNVVTNYNNLLPEPYYSRNNQTSYNNYVWLNFNPGLLFFPHKKVSIGAYLGNILGMSYNVSDNYFVFSIMNVSTVNPNIGVSFWFL